MLYLYGVTHARREQPALVGVGAPPAPVRLVQSGPVAAAVSEVPEDWTVHDEDARAHLQVLIGLLEQGPVLPVRLGTVAPGPDEVRTEVLDAAQQELVGQLDALDGLVELQVDADDDEAASIARLTRSGELHPDRSTDLASRIELGQQIAEQLVAYRHRVADEILNALRPLAVRDVPRATIRSAEDPVLRWAFLVAEDEIARFDAAVVAVRTEHPELVLRYAGPLPPSHFVDWQPGGRTPSEQTDSFQAQGAWGWD
jgi:hypothetical protein